MIYDLNILKEVNNLDNKFDVCIIGAGAAGITIANKLKKAGLKIALCEAGSYEYTEESQDFYKGKLVGDHYFDLDIARLRYLGGSTNHWGGWCRSFEPVDFDRGYLGEEYKWPITYKELFKFRNTACNILEIDDDFDFKSSEDKKVKKIKFQFSPPVRFKDKYQDELQKASNVNVFINANLYDISGENSIIKFAHFKSYTKNKIKIQASKFIFAMGGIENSRFLLWFKKKYQNKFFDNTTPIGKYWMEHPHFNLGSALVNKSVTEQTYYSLTQKAQKESQILNCGFRINKITSNKTTKSMIKELLCIAPKIGQKIAYLADKNLVCGARLFAAWEQSPNISNTITLSENKDKFEIPRVNLKWKKNSFDRENVKESVRIFNDWLLEDDLGRIQLHKWMLNDLEYPTDDELGGYHHMGGTRMSNSPKLGVVDKNCKVFGSQNLYIAGSSVFTTGGHNNPTLPIVQFSLRLAEHLLKSKV